MGVEIPVDGMGCEWSGEMSCDGEASLTLLPRERRRLGLADRGTEQRAWRSLRARRKCVLRAASRQMKGGALVRDVRDVGWNVARPSRMLTERWAVGVCSCCASTSSALDGATRPTERSEKEAGRGGKDEAEEKGRLRGGRFGCVQCQSSS